jgi:gas vesicle protein
MTINRRSAPGFLAGLVFGGLAGAAAALLFAPQSGKQTRELFREEGVQLGDRVYNTVKDGRARAGVIVDETKVRMEDLQQQGRKIIGGSKDLIEKTAKAVKTAAQETLTESGLARPAAG